MHLCWENLPDNCPWWDIYIGIRWDPAGWMVNHHMVYYDGFNHCVWFGPFYFGWTDFEGEFPNR